MNTKALLVVLILSLPVSAITLTITKSSLFERLREWALERNEWLGKLVSCPYCTSHWVSFALVAWYQPRMLHSVWLPVDLIISAFAIVALAIPISFVVYCSFTGIGKIDNDAENKEVDLQRMRNALANAKEKLIEQGRQIKAMSEQLNN